MLILMLAISLLLSWAPAQAAQIGHSYTEVTTQQTTTSTSYTDVTGAVIASGNFTAGKKYLLYITAQANENSSGVVSVKAQHGTTDFAESEGIMVSIGSADRVPYGFLTVWTAVSSEGIKLRFKTSTGTGALDQITLLAINLSDDVTENTDWFFAQRSTDDSLSTTPDNGASVTFTPGTAGQDWLVLSYAQIDSTDTATSASTNITRSGEASSSTPSAKLEWSSSSVVQPMLLARGFTLSNASNTFTEVSASTGSTHTRLHSSLFALNLDKFRNHGMAYTDADTGTLSATAYGTTLQTTSISNDVAGDIWVLGYWGADANSASRLMKTRIQVDGSDVPPGQTVDSRTFRMGADTTDEYPLIQSAGVVVSSGSHTVTMSGSVDSTANASTGQHRFLMAVSMELPSGAVPSTGRRGPIAPVEF